MQQPTKQDELDISWTSENRQTEPSYFRILKIIKNVKFIKS